MIGAARGSDQTGPEAEVTTERHPAQHPLRPKRSSSCATQTDTRRLYALRMRPQIRYRSLNVVTLERLKRYAQTSALDDLREIRVLIYLFACRVAGYSCK